MIQPRVFSVVTDPTQYNTYVKQNPNLKDCICVCAINTPSCNISIATHYNRFIDEIILPEKKDGWVIFCHQDFEWLEDPSTKLATLNPQIIYGPVGMQSRKLPILHNCFVYGRSYCQIPTETFICGHTSKYPQLVDTLDCCCIFMHSSLLKKYKLRFDDYFDFHCYVEDFCLAAFEKKIVVYAIQLACHHHSDGKLDKLFFERYDQLCKKYMHRLFTTTLIPLQWRIIKKTYYFPSFHTRWLFDIVFDKIAWPIRSFLYRSIAHIKRSVG